MAYRPQRLMNLPEGVIAEPFAIPVVQNDVNNGSVITAQREIPNIPIPVDKDFDFWLCGIAYGDPAVFDLLGLRLRDAWGNYLQDDYALCSAFMPLGVAADASGGGAAPGFEPPVFCPKGSYLQLDVKNLGLVTSYAWGNMELRGFKTVAEVCA